MSYTRPTDAALDRYERAIGELAQGLELDPVDAAFLARPAASDTPGWLFIFLLDEPLAPPTLHPQYITDAHDCWAALWCERHVFAVDLQDTNQGSTTK